MQVSYELHLDDLRASDRFWASRYKSTFWSSFGLLLARATLVLFLLPAVVAPLYYLDSPTFKSAWNASGPLALWPLGIALIPLLALGGAWFGAPLLQPLAFRSSPFYQKQITLTLESDGLRGETLTPWSELHAVEETPAHIFITFGHNRVFIIPKRAFSSDFAATQFAANCRDFWTKARENQQP